MLLGKLLGGLDLGLRDIAREQAGHTDTLLVNVHHDRERVGVRQVKDRLEHPDHKLLGGEVVVMEQYFPEPGMLDPFIDLGLGLDPVANFWIRHVVIISRKGLAFDLESKDTGRMRMVARQVLVQHPVRGRLLHEQVHLGDKLTA